MQKHIWMGMKERNGLAFNLMWYFVLYYLQYIPVHTAIFSIHRIQKKSKKNSFEKDEKNKIDAPPFAVMLSRVDWWNDPFENCLRGFVNRYHRHNLFLWFSEIFVGQMNSLFLSISQNAKKNIEWCNAWSWFGFGWWDENPSVSIYYKVGVMHMQISNLDQ